SYVVTGALNNASWRELCRILDRQDLLEDPRFANEQERLRNRSALDALLNETFSTRTSEEWVALFEANGFVISPVNGLREALGHAQIAANEIVVTAEHEAAGPVKLVGTPMTFEHWRLQPRRPPPVLGRHTDEVLSELGYTSQQIESLRKDGVI